MRTTIAALTTTALVLGITTPLAAGPTARDRHDQVQALWAEARADAPGYGTPSALGELFGVEEATDLAKNAGATLAPVEPTIDEPETDAR